MRKIFRQAQDKGFTLIELLIVMSVVAILVSIIIPSLRGLQQEAWLAKAETETETLQVAVESYYRHKNSYPIDITSALQAAQPAIVTNILKDPFKTSGAPYNTYGYTPGTASNGELYYIIYSNGVDASGSYTLNNDKVYYPEGMIVRSNLPTIQD